MVPSVNSELDDVEEGNCSYGIMKSSMDGDDLNREVRVCMVRKLRLG